MLDMHSVASTLFASWQFWIVILIIVIATIIVAIFFPGRPTLKEYIYRKKTSIMTPSEQKLFVMLVEILGDDYYVFPQVHLDALLDYKVPGQSWFGAFKHINEKSVDFVICDKVHETPLLAIELDDDSHRREDRIKRDMVVNSIFRNAFFPLLRIDSKDASDKQFIEQRLNGYLNLGTSISLETGRSDMLKSV